MHKGHGAFEGTGQGVDRARGNRNIRPPGDFEQAQRVLGRQLGMHVAEDGGQPDDLQLGRAEGEEDGHGVVHAGVGVNDDLSGMSVILPSSLVNALVSSNQFGAIDHEMRHAEEVKTRAMPAGQDHQ